MLKLAYASHKLCVKHTIKLDKVKGSALIFLEILLVGGYIYVRKVVFLHNHQMRTYFE